MVREQAVRLRQLVRAQLLERRADDAVQVSPALVEQARVRRFAHEAVTEAVLRRRPTPLLDDEVEPLQLRERRTQQLGRDEPLEQRLAEAATDDGRDRRHLAHVGCESVESRLERLLDCGRHCGTVAALDRIPCRLLEEERVAAGALGERRGDVFGEIASGRRGCELHRGRRIERLEQQLAEPVAVTSSRRLAELPRAQVGVVAIREQRAPPAPRRRAGAAPRTARASARRRSAGLRGRGTPAARARARARARSRPRATGAERSRARVRRAAAPRRPPA